MRAMTMVNHRFTKSGVRTTVRQQYGNTTSTRTYGAERPTYSTTTTRTGNISWTRRTKW